MDDNTVNNNIENRVNNTQEVNKEDVYIRVGISLYRVVNDAPQTGGSTVVKRVPWSFRTLQQDYGKGNIPEIKKYKGFCIEPSHLYSTKESYMWFAPSLIRVENVKRIITRLMRKTLPTEKR